jgi:hypothetical protein
MRPNRLLVVATIVSVTAAIFFGMRWQMAERRADEAERLTLAPAYPRTFLEDFEIARLKKLGLDDPILALRSDLSSRKDLVRFESGVGGTTAFYDRAAMILLPGGYAYAPAEDGHYLIHAVLRYDVAPGGKVTWKLLDSRLDD